MHAVASHSKTLAANTDANSSAPAADFFGAPVSTYTRAHAIADGLLIDVSDTARRAGFKIPVAMTRAAYASCVTWSAEDSKRQTYQDEDARLWDVLYMCQLAARTTATNGDRMIFSLHRVARGGTDRMPRMKRLKAILGPGDTFDPVITIMEINED